MTLLELKMTSDPKKEKKLSASQGIKDTSDFLHVTNSESLTDKSMGSDFHE